MRELVRPYILTNQNSSAFWLIDNLWLPLAVSGMTGGRFSLMEQVCGVGIGGPPTHSHPSDEGLYIIEGHCTFNVGGQTIEAGPGTFAFVPRLTEHSFSVDQPGSRLLNFYTPGGFELVVMSVAQPAAERKPPAPGSTPMPPRWMVEETSREFGQIPVLGLPFADPRTKDNIASKPSLLNPIRPFGAESERAPAYWSQGSLFVILASVAQTGGSFSLLEQRCPKGSGPAPHMHEQDEVFYLLEGSMTVILGDEVRTVGGGALVYIPKHTVHSFRVDTAEARLFNWYLPGGFESTITRFGQPAASRTLPPPDLKEKATPEQLKAHFEQVGMREISVPDVLRA